ncbi:DnaJ domain-containing protein [Halopenitus sp. H-Gu1]|uniref:DnaJ domain-containing protein n=1 Tax=Halopenitus sp. H-Gu1 TaxID=3242697 RepID=UPI00359E4D57
MTNRPLVVGLAATFIGLTVVLAVAGIVVHPILIFVAIPFALAAYLLWLHASGRLAERVRSRRTRTRTRGSSSQSTRTREYASARASARTNRDAAVGGADAAPPSGGPSRREAAETLGVDPDADQETIRSAYREQAKSIHPDAEEGDESAFKELTRAYDRLRR